MGRSRTTAHRRLRCRPMPTDHPGADICWYMPRHAHHIEKEPAKHKPRRHGGVRQDSSQTRAGTHQDYSVGCSLHSKGRILFANPPNATSHSVLVLWWVFRSVRNIRRLHVSRKVHELQRAIHHVMNATFVHHARATAPPTRTPWSSTLAMLSLESFAWKLSAEERDNTGDRRSSAGATPAPMPAPAPAPNPAPAPIPTPGAAALPVRATSYARVPQYGWGAHCGGAHVAPVLPVTAAKRP